MRKHFVGLLLVLLAAGGVLAWHFSQQQEFQFEKTALLNGFDAGDDIQSVSVTTHDAALLQAEKVDGQWRLLPENYPLEDSQLRELLQQLAKTNLVEAKTNRKAQYHRLGVSDIAEAESQARLLTLSSQGGSTLSVLVGNTSQNGRGQYVRFPKQPQSYLTDGVIELPQTASDWYRARILPFEASSLLAIERQGADGWQLSFIDAAWHLTSADGGFNLRYPGILDAVTEAVSQLSQDGLATEAFPATALVSFTLKTDTTQYQLDIAKGQQDMLVRLTGGDATGYWQDKVYQVSAFKVSQFNLTQAELLAEPATPAPAAGQE